MPAYLRSAEILNKSTCNVQYPFVALKIVESFEIRLNPLSTRKILLRGPQYLCAAFQLDDWGNQSTLHCEQCQKSTQLYFTGPIWNKNARRTHKGGRISPNEVCWNFSFPIVYKYCVSVNPITSYGSVCITHLENLPRMNVQLQSSLFSARSWCKNVEKNKSSGFPELN